MVKHKGSQKYLIVGVVVIILAVLTYAFWPKPVLVDIGEVTRGGITVTIDEEARTRVHDTYLVSTPVAGRLLRVAVEPGDRVERRKTIVAQMLPAHPPTLDERSHKQARAGVSAAEAALRVTQANRKKAIADRDLALANFERARQLLKIRTISQADFEQKEREVHAARATLENADAEIALRQAELANAEAQLMGFEASGSAKESGLDQAEAIALTSPTDGRVLRVIQKSATTLPAGSPVVEIGDVENALEVIVELLSTDAVQVKEGNRVIIDNWGGPDSLAGVVQRIDPSGFTKFSALGVEEQRVNGIIRFTDASERHAGLGHGFRVEVRIVTWEDEDAVLVPSSALFRNQGEWAVFTVIDGTAELRPVLIENTNGSVASVTQGLTPGDRVILYPASELESGDRVASR